MGDIILIAPPKAGSHMLANALELNAARPWMQKRSGIYNSIEGVLETLPAMGDRVWCHLPFEKKIYDTVLENYDVVIFLRRDPRDIIVSHACYLDTVNKSPLDYKIDNDTWLSDLSIKFRIEWLIMHFVKIYGVYTPWIYQDGILQLSYEELFRARAREMYKIKTYCKQANIYTPSTSSMVQMSYNPVESAFRRGKTGDWKDAFTLEQKMVAQIELESKLYLWGYDEDP